MCKSGFWPGLSGHLFFPGLHNPTRLVHNFCMKFGKFSWKRAARLGVYCLAGIALFFLLAIYGVQFLWGSTLTIRNDSDFPLTDIQMQITRATNTPNEVTESAPMPDIPPQASIKKRINSSDATLTVEWFWGGRRQHAKCGYVSSILIDRELTVDKNGAGKCEMVRK